jgi:hypothetical protein
MDEVGGWLGPDAEGDAVAGRLWTRRWVAARPDHGGARVSHLGRASWPYVFGWTAGIGNLEVWCCLRNLETWKVVFLWVAAATRLGQQGLGQRNRNRMPRLPLLVRLERHRVH